MPRRLVRKTPQEGPLQQSRGQGEEALCSATELKGIQNSVIEIVLQCTIFKNQDSKAYRNCRQKQSATVQSRIDS